MIIWGLVSADYLSGGRKNSAKPFVFYHSSVADFGYTGHYDAGRAYWNGFNNATRLESYSFFYIAL